MPDHMKTLKRGRSNDGNSIPYGAYVKYTTQNTKTEWSLTGGGCLQESNRNGSLPRRGPGTFALWRIIYCMHCLS